MRRVLRRTDALLQWEEGIQSGEGENDHEKASGITRETCSENRAGTGSGGSYDEGGGISGYYIPAFATEEDPVGEETPDAGDAYEEETLESIEESFTEEAMFDGIPATVDGDLNLRTQQKGGV